jgi:Flp pilus assembly pilin Flp
MGTSIKRVLRDRRGLSTVEYIIILALIAVACITAWNNFGDAVHDRIGEAEDELRNMHSPGGGGGGGGGP